MLSVGMAVLQVILLLVLRAWLVASGVIAFWNSTINQVTTNKSYDISGIVTVPNTLAIGGALGVVLVFCSVVGSLIGCALYRGFSRITGGALVGLQRPSS